MKLILNTFILFFYFSLINISAQETQIGVTWQGELGICESTFEIMAREILVGPMIPEETEAEKIWPDRSHLPQNPESQHFAYWPPEQNNIIPNLPENDSPQTPGINFTAATLSGTNPTSAFPPDCMGAVGPTQYIVAVNNRIVSFNKTTGVADGILNLTTNTFFSSVRNGAGTSDPRIRYDRATQRWFVIIINVSTPNRILIAISDAASSGIISGSTVWTYFFIPIDSINPPISNTCLADYPTLGIDVNALYIGTNNFCGSPSQTFNSTDGYVVRKSSILGVGPIVVTVFRGLVPTSTSAGPYTPQGVDNFDVSSADGYFIGVDNATFGTLMLRRVTDPGSTPSISSNIAITVNATSFPLTVRHLGNTGGTNGRLDALDDRLFAAVIRNNRLWTSHNIGVNNMGSTSSATRNGSRWYEINNLSVTPTIIQSGTVFQVSASNTTDQRNYWIPTVGISGQGHAAIGFSVAGTNEYINAGTVGRLSSDASGSMGTPLLFTSSTTAYNPSGDPGTRGARRWGDYSFVSVDPLDDMTMWTVQEFCDATNSYGVRVVQLLAPPPATPSSANPPAVAPNLTSVNVVITGTVVNGSGFFNPGAGFPNQISASLPAGIVVNNVTYTSPTQVSLNLNTTGVANGSYTVTITNPDGQSRTSATGILTIDSNLPVELSSFTAKILRSGGIKLDWRTETEVNNYGFEILRSTENDSAWKKIGFVEGHGNSNSPKEYSFTDEVINYGSYSYRLKQIDTDGSFEYSNVVQVDAGNIPNGFVLEQNYPNPFNPSTTISFTLLESGKVRLTVYNLLGEEIAELINEVKDAGVHTINFDASGLNSGIYIYKIENGILVQSKKMSLIK